MQFGTLLWHGEEPIGICVFIGPPLSLAPRNRYFGRSGEWTRTNIRAMNGQLAMLSRVVLHPTYRGAGLAAAFVRRSCELSPFPWIETLAEMGHVNPVFEKAGFVRVDTTGAKGRTRRKHSALYGGKRRNASLIGEETYRKSRYAQPVYYVFDNREACLRRSKGERPGRFQRPGR
jgi:ABC-type ATPase with predicted acetyltransferase domain